MIADRLRPRPISECSNNRFKHMIKKKYIELKEKYINEKGYAVPSIYQSSFVHWGGGVDVQYIYKKFLEKLSPGSKIIVVGVMGGRDFFLLKNLGYDVTALDIGPQPEISPITFCNIEDTLPFPENTFDAVLIGEVLEHLKFDIAALENIKRVLKPAGKLIVSIPFYNDWEDGHMRIHSPISGKRLLELAGFSVENYLERPGFVWFAGFNMTQHGISFLKNFLTGKTAYPWTTMLIGRIEWILGHLIWLRPIRKLSKHFGGYYLCCKSDDLIDHISINKNLYTGDRISNPK